MKIFYLPDLGEGLAEAEIQEWYVKEGDEVTVDQPLVSMETAKAVVDVPSPHTGKIVKLHGKKGDIIQTHAALVEFAGEEIQTTIDKGTVVGSLEESSTILNEGDVIIGPAKKASTSIKAMPAVRNLAKELAVDISTITTGSGPQGFVTAEDVKKLAAKNSKLPGNTEILRGVRRTMATIMTQSHQSIVPATIMDDADITDARKADFTVLLLKAIAVAAKAEPSLNAWYDGNNMERCVHQEVHIGLAMDTEEGLFVPVLKNVANKTSDELRESIDAFKKSVRDRTILPSDFQGATISLSNFGTIAGRYANPIVVPPMVAILGCGKWREEVVSIKGEMKVRQMAPLSLTFDHRAVTGGEATRFLASIIKTLAQG